MTKLKGILLTQGMHGMISQVEGLAKALDLNFTHHTVELNNFWEVIPPKLTPISQNVYKKLNLNEFDLIISCGRKSVIPSIHLNNTANRKIFNIDLTQHPSWFFKNIAPTLDYESNMVSYYENSDYYAPHRDRNDVTILCWIYREPKKFEGGDLYFPAYDSGLRVKNNRVVIFPGFIEHGVFPVEMEKTDDDKKWGRYCITSFLLAKDGL